MLPDVTYIMGDEVLVEPHPDLVADLDRLSLPEADLVETFWGMVTGETLVGHPGSLGVTLRDALADKPLGQEGDLVLTDQRLLVVDKLAAAPVVGVRTTLRRRHEGDQRYRLRGAGGDPVRRQHRPLAPARRGAARRGAAAGRRTAQDGAPLRRGLSCRTPQRGALSPSTTRSARADGCCSLT